MSTEQAVGRGEEIIDPIFWKIMDHEERLTYW